MLRLEQVGGSGGTDGSAVDVLRGLPHSWSLAVIGCRVHLSVGRRLLQEANVEEDFTLLMTGSRTVLHRSPSIISVAVKLPVHCLNAHCSLATDIWTGHRSPLSVLSFNILALFLAALSSSRSLVVGPSVRPSVRPSVHLCEKSDL